MRKLHIRNHVAEFMNRLRLDPVAGETGVYDYTPVYGEVYQQGDPVLAEQLNTIQTYIDEDKQEKVEAVGLLKGEGSGSVSAAVAGSDYATPAQVAAKQDAITAVGLLKGDGSVVSAAVAGTDYATPAQVAAKLDAAALLDKVYPVGAIYISTNIMNPGYVLGGTWEAYAQGQFLLGAGGGYAAGSTGGAASVTLTTQQMPAHAHRMTRMPYAWNEVDESSTDIPGRVRMYGWTTETAYTRNGIDWSSDTNPAHYEPIGGGQAHENMPPYIVCYMWRRIA